MVRTWAFTFYPGGSYGGVFSKGVIQSAFFVKDNSECKMTGNAC